MSKSEAPTSGSSSKVLDFLGREIVAGGTVCYPVRRGSSMWLQKPIFIS